MAGHHDAKHLPVARVFRDLARRISVMLTAARHALTERTCGNARMIAHQLFSPYKSEYGWL